MVLNTLRQRPCFHVSGGRTTVMHQSCKWEVLEDNLRSDRRLVDGAVPHLECGAVSSVDTQLYKI